MMKKWLIAFAFVAVANSTPAQAENTELKCMALNLYHEARGEDAVGIIAVGQVVLNRVNSKQFPNTVCDVVRQGGERLNRCQFSWWCDGRSDRARDKEAWKQMVVYAILLLSDNRLGDPTVGAIFYHTVSVEPYWAASRTKVVMLGSHVFYQ